MPIKKRNSTKGSDSLFEYTSKVDGKPVKYHPKEPKPSVLGNALNDLIEAGDIEPKPSVLGNALNDLIEARGFEDTSEKYPGNIQVFQDEEQNDRYFSTNEFIIQFNDGVSNDDARQTINNFGSSIKVASKRIKGLYIAIKPDNKELPKVIREFNEQKIVAFCEPSEYGKDDRLSLRPTLQDISDQKKFWALQRIEVCDAWEKGIGKEHVIISIVDTGVDLAHDDLKPNLLERGGEDWDFADDKDLVPEDEGEYAYHGTFIAGIAAAAYCNPNGMIGVCPKAKIMPLRVLLSSKNDLNKYFDRFEAIRFIAEKAKADKKNRYVLSCSWKISGDSKFILYAIREAVKNGVLVIFAAGNDNKDLKRKPLYPAAYPDVLTVAATNRDDKKWADSNYGESVDVCAPGDNVWSTVGNNGHDFNSGTSFAVPYVAGLAALLWSTNPSLSNYEVREIIESTCDEINDPKYKGCLGNGRINVKAAVNKALDSMKKGGIM